MTRAQPQRPDTSARSPLPEPVAATATGMEAGPTARVPRAPSSEAIGFSVSPGCRVQHDAHAQDPQGAPGADDLPRPGLARRPPAATGPRHRLGRIPGGFLRSSTSSMRPFAPTCSAPGSLSRISRASPAAGYRARAPRPPDGRSRSWPRRGSPMAPLWPTATVWPSGQERSAVVNGDLQMVDWDIGPELGCRHWCGRERLPSSPRSRIVMPVIS